MTPKQELALIRALGLVIAPSEGGLLARIQSSPESISRVANPSEELQLAAVRKKGWVIRYIKNPSEAVQSAAEKAQRSSVMRTPRNIRHIKNPSPEVQIAAVRKMPVVIGLIEEPTEAVQVLALMAVPFYILSWREKKLSRDPVDMLNDHIPGLGTYFQMLRDEKYPDNLIARLSRKADEGYTNRKPDCFGEELQAFVQQCKENPLQEFAPVDGLGELLDAHLVLPL